MTTRRLVMVPSVRYAPPDSTDVRVVALDTAWTPRAGDPTHVIPLRDVIAPILARIDLFRDALDRLEAWEDATGVADRMTVAGVSWWFRQRPFIWYLLHEHRLWLAILDELGARDVQRLEIPADEPTLEAVARQLVGLTGQDLQVAVAEPEASASPSRAAASSNVNPSTARGSLIDRMARRIRRELTGQGAPRPAPKAARTTAAQSALDDRMAALDERIQQLSSHAGRSVVVVSHPRVFQLVDTGDAAGLVDPQLAPVMRRLSEREIPLINVALELDLRRDEDWARIEADDRLIPDSYVRRRWADDDPSSDAADVVPRLREARGIPIDVDGVDLAPIVLDRLEQISGSWLASQDRLRRAAHRLFDELRPGAMFLNHEGIRTPWLAAARARAIPIHAIQHGVIYPTHPVYRHARHPGLVIPDRTHVYGPYEQDVLIRYGDYEPSEIEVSGSPRLDVVADPAGRSADDEREAVRRSLGVDPEARMLVLSTANHVLAWRFHIAEAMGRILGGPLAGVHVVIKLHPGESDEGPYRALLTGLAEGGGYAAPPISVVHDIDLFRLLRAADAHLGFHSTVLTDAVAAGAVNLMAAGHATADWLGYVEAGVALPVRDVAGLRAALADPKPPDPGARERFLARHFRGGDASDRIADAIASSIRGAGTPHVELREAQPDDMDLLLGWANDPVTRAAGFAPDPIEPDQHRRWFSDRLASTTDRLLIGTVGGKPVGQIRLDRSNDGTVEVGIAVAPDERQRGIGSALLRAGIARAGEDPVLAPTRLVARIRPSNERSIALFTRAGFRLVAETEVRGMACLVYERPA